ncbi:MAG: type II toxin-antitoxin system PemK/MazF family toxin [Candidatus Absconditabacterales bacterium]
METEQQFDLWNIQKKNIHNKYSTIYFREGDIRRCSLGMNIRTEAYGKGESFRRPILILKKLSDDSCIIIPLSSKSKIGTRFCEYTLHGTKGTALLYQIKMLHKNRFQRKIGELDEKDFGTIKKRLKQLLNL